MGNFINILNMIKSATFIFWQINVAPCVWFLFIAHVLRVSVTINY